MSSASTDFNSLSSPSASMNLGKSPIVGGIPQKKSYVNDSFKGLKRESKDPVNKPKASLVKGNGMRMYTSEGKADKSYTVGQNVKGVNSLFNNYILFTHSFCNGINDFYDKQGENGVFGHVEDKPELTIGNLLADFTPDKSPSMPYFANDFLYAKYYDKIPLNRLLTLRRFAYPVYDNLQFSNTNRNDIKPIAQAITYFGDPTDNKLSSLFSITGSISWKNVSSQIWDEANQTIPTLESQKNAVTGFVPTLGGRLSGINLKGYVGQGMDMASRASTFTGDSQTSDLSGASNSRIDAIKASRDFSYIHKVLGPINVIKDTMTRESGIGADLSFRLKFEYELKSYKNINPKLAMLDLIGNMLALTFYHAKWWGGANRFTPRVMEQFGFLGDYHKLYSGDYGGFFKSVAGNIGSVMGKTGNALSGLWQSMMSGNFQSLFSNLLGGGKIGGDKMLDMATKKSRPNIVAIHSLVSGAPVGEYHLVVGNPYNPIYTIGNLICDSFTVTPSDELGFDDFPTKWTLEISLKRARKMDSGDIQAILNAGQGRTYLPLSGMLDEIIGDDDKLKTNSEGTAVEFQNGDVKNGLSINATDAQGAGGVVY